MTFEEPVISRVRNLKKKLITKVFIKVIADSLKLAFEENEQYLLE